MSCRNEFKDSKNVVYNFFASLIAPEHNPRYLSMFWLYRKDRESYECTKHLMDNMYELVATGSVKEWDEETEEENNAKEWEQEWEERSWAEFRANKKAEEKSTEKTVEEIEEDLRRLDEESSRPSYNRKIIK